jgi:hypothetical protein
VVGQTQAAATAALTAAGYQTTVVQAASFLFVTGTVISHNPIAGVSFPLGGNVTINVSTGNPQSAGYGGDTWGATGGDITSVDSFTPLGQVLAYAQQPINALNAAPNQSVAAALSNGGSITQATPNTSVPTTPTVG